MRSFYRIILLVAKLNRWCGCFLSRTFCIYYCVADTNFITWNRRFENFNWMLLRAAESGSTRNKRHNYIFGETTYYNCTDHSNEQKNEKTIVMRKCQRRATAVTMFWGALNIKSNCSTSTKTNYIESYICTMHLLTLCGLCAVHLNIMWFQMYLLVFGTNNVRFEYEIRARLTIRTHWSILNGSRHKIEIEIHTKCQHRRCVQFARCLCVQSLPAFVQE